MITRYCVALRLCGVTLLLLLLLLLPPPQRVTFASAERLRNIAPDSRISRRVKSLITTNATHFELNVVSGSNHSNVVDTAAGSHVRRRHNTARLIRRKRTHDDDADAHERTRPRQCVPPCQLTVRHLHNIQHQFQDAVYENAAHMITFKINFLDSNRSLLETYPYMGNSFRASEWVWIRGRIGRYLLGLPLDADALSLYVLPLSRRRFTLDVVSSPPQCFARLTSKCRLKVIQELLINNITSLPHKRSSDDEHSYVCHRILPTLATSLLIGLMVRWDCRFLFRFMQSHWP